MPIKPENKARYPENWKEIRDSAVMRAGDRCEDCYVPNGANGYRGKNGDFIEVGDRRDATMLIAKCLSAHGLRPMFRIVLTVHHLDEKPENNDHGNLVALCQKCHLAKHRKTKETA